MASSVGEIRAWWRRVHPPPTLTKRLEPVYYVLITLGIGGPLYMNVMSGTDVLSVGWSPTGGMVLVETFAVHPVGATIEPGTSPPKS